MSDGMHIDFDQAAFQQFKRNKKQFIKEVLSVAANGLKKSAARIVAEAKQKIKDNGSIATGMLRSSGSVRPQVDGTVDAGFYADYAYWVEYGRKAGGMPPVKLIKEWVRKKHLSSDEKEIDSMAFAIAKNIAANGTKAKPFLTPSYEENKARIDEIMQKAINEVVNNYNGK
jgi:hypothetical protein